MLYYTMIALACTYIASLQGQEQNERSREKLHSSREQHQQFHEGNWENRTNWQYYRNQYYSGESQSAHDREQRPFGPGGIGYDADPDYVKSHEGQNNEGSDVNRRRREP